MRKKILIIGAGIGGLSAAMRLSRMADVTVLEAHDAPGGKMRTLPSDAGPVDAGPTVMTLRPIFDDLFAAAGAQLEEQVTLTALDCLAQHIWPDGSQLMLYADPDKSAEAMRDFAGPKAAEDFRRFCIHTQTLFDAFSPTILETPSPKLWQLVKTVMQNPRLWAAALPSVSLAQSLALRFRDPRLRQLFGRYATYVGGSPFNAPAVLALIWQAEAAGVWRVAGGMHTLAHAMARVVTDNGGNIHYSCFARDIEIQNGQAYAVHTSTQRIVADAVLYAGDPRALSLGYLGEGLKQAVPHSGVTPRSLSAFVWAFAAKPEATVPLSQHNVFFGDSQSDEFSALRKGKRPIEATLYVCAQDHSQVAPDAVQRFEIILNGPPRAGRAPNTQEMAECHRETFTRLAKMGLRFTPDPGPQSLSTPEVFNNLFPGSEGSLYGRSPHGMRATFQRPQARSRIPGLYLAGGGVHPGAGIPMAALSGKHAAAAIMTDLGLT